MEKGIRSIMNAVIEEINEKYKTLYEVGKELGYKDHSYISLKAKKLGLGLRVKRQLLLSPEDVEKIKNSITRRDKDDKEGE